jgi:dipeptidyl-peptidase-3
VIQARFAIVQVLLAAPDNFFVLAHSEEYMDDLTIHIDKKKILSSGIPTIGKFLQKLHVYNSTADVVNGTKLYEEMTVVDDYFLRIREVVLRKKQPRKLFVQPNTRVEGGEVVLKDYEASYRGIIESWAERGV